MSITLDEIVLDASTSNIAISDGTDTLAINGDGSLNAVVTASQLDIDDLDHATDSVNLGDGTSTWDLQTIDSAFNATGVSVGIAGVRRDADTSPVSADGDAHPLVFDANGRLKVESQVSVEASDAEYAEDSAHVSGDVGLHMLAVRQDTLAASVSADGDYGSFKIDSLGRLYTNTSLSSAIADDAVDTENPIKIGGEANGGLLSALSASGDRYHLLGDLYRRTYVNNAYNVAIEVTTETVGATAAQIVATPMAGRKSMTIQNTSNNSVWLGHNGSVTADNAATGGLEIKKNTSYSDDFGENIDVFLISDGAGRICKVLEKG